MRERFCKAAEAFVAAQRLCRWTRAHILANVISALRRALDLPCCGGLVRGAHHLKKCKLFLVSVSIRSILELLMGGTLFVNIPISKSISVTTSSRYRKDRDFGTSQLPSSRNAPRIPIITGRVRRGQHCNHLSPSFLYLCYFRT